SAGKDEGLFLFRHDAAFSVDDGGTFPAGGDGARLVRCVRPQRTGLEYRYVASGRKRIERVTFRFTDAGGEEKFVELPMPHRKRATVLGHQFRVHHPRLGSWRLEDL